MGHYVLNHAYKGLVMAGVLIVIGFAFLTGPSTPAWRAWGEKWEVRGVTDVRCAASGGDPVRAVLLSPDTFTNTI